MVSIFLKKHINAGVNVICQFVHFFSSYLSLIYSLLLLRLYSNDVVSGITSKKFSRYRRFQPEFFIIPEEGWVSSAEMWCSLKKKTINYCFSADSFFSFFFSLPIRSLV